MIFKIENLQNTILEVELFFLQINVQFERLKRKDFSDVITELNGKISNTEKDIEKNKKNIEDNELKINNLENILKQITASKQDLIVQTSNEITRLKLCFIIFC